MEGKRKVVLLRLCADRKLELIGRDMKNKHRIGDILKAYVRVLHGLAVLSFMNCFSGLRSVGLQKTTKLTLSQHSPMANGPAEGKLR
jgi:hypothetical protein